MPGWTSYLFSGSAITAFIVVISSASALIGSGYGWYRAALTEEGIADKAATEKISLADKERADKEAKEHREAIKASLADFLNRGERLSPRIMDPADLTIVSDANAWMNEASLYVRDNLGKDHLARMNTGAGVVTILHQAPTPERTQLGYNVYIRVLRLQEFLKEMA
jgi:hypothetical protein